MATEVPSIKVSQKVKPQPFIEKTLVPALKENETIELSGLGNGNL